MWWQAIVAVLAVVVWRSLSWRWRAELWVSAVVVPTLVGPGRLSVEGLRRRITATVLWELTGLAGQWGRLPEETGVALAPVDAGRLGEVWGAVEAELVMEVRALAERWCWSVPADPQVMLVEDPSVAVGRPRAHGRFREGTDPVPAPHPAAARTATAPLRGATRRTRPPCPGPPAPGTLACELISLDGRGPDIALGDDTPVISVGRAGCDVIVRDAVVSARHAELRRAGPQWLVRDCRSTNGVAVNGTMVDGYIPLLHNDEVIFGWGGPRYVFSRLSPGVARRGGRRGA